MDGDDEGLHGLRAMTHTESRSRLTEDNRVAHDEDADHDPVARLAALGAVVEPYRVGPAHEPHVRIALVARIQVVHGMAAVSVQQHSAEDALLLLLAFLFGHRASQTQVSQCPAYRLMIRGAY